MNLDELFGMAGKVALVTGGGRGIGKAIAEGYLEAGATVAITGRREAFLNEAVQEFVAREFACLAVVSDVTSSENVKATVAEVLEKFGRIDVLVNNAGQTWGQSAEDLPIDKWRQIIDVNLTSMFEMSQAVGRHMLDTTRGGRIINIASIAGLTVGNADAPKTIAYNTSKAAIIALTRSLAMEWGRRGILVNAIAPGWFPTRMAAATIEANRSRFELDTALGRLGELDDLKGAAIFLASNASNYITGQTIVVDGGSVL